MFNDIFDKDLFVIKPSAPDGHCLLHSVVSGMSEVTGNVISLPSLLNAIRNETIRDITSLSEIYSSSEMLIKEMDDYLDCKIYNSSYGDIVPQIIANALSANLHIALAVENNNRIIRVISQCAGEKINLFLYKTDEHYDALIPKIVQNNSAHTPLDEPRYCCRHDNGMHSIKTNVHECPAMIRKRYNLRICFWNVYGLSNDFLDHDICGKFLKTYDIILMCETWTDAEDHFELDGFHSFNYSRPIKHKDAIRASGGLYIFIKNSIRKGIEIKHNREDIIAWIRLKKTFFGFEHDLYIANCYIVPEKSHLSHEDPFGLILDDITRLPDDCYILMAGDYNAHTNDESGIMRPICGRDVVNEQNDILDLFESEIVDIPDRFLSRSSLDKRPLNNHGKRLIELCKSTSLLILNGRVGDDVNVGNFTSFNHKCRGVLDYMIASPSLLRCITNFKVHSPFPESDHSPLELCLRCNYSDADSYNSTQLGDWSSHFRYVWKQNDINRLKGVLFDDISNDYYNDYRDSLSEISQTNAVAAKFDSFITQACQRTFDMKETYFKKRYEKAKWFDAECLELRSQAVKAGERSHTAQDKHRLNKACKDYRACKQRKKRLFKQKCIAEIDKIAQSNPSELWTFLKKVKRNNDITKPSGEEFFQHFENLTNPEIKNNFDCDYEKAANLFLKNYDSGKDAPKSATNIEYELLNDFFTCDEVSIAIDSLKNNKSPGADCIPAEFIKKCKDELLDDVTKLFNYIIEKREFPERWAEGIKSAIFKKGDRLNTHNYRGITVPRIFEKLFEIAVYNRLQFFNEAFDKVDKTNGGFLKGMRTTDNMFILNGLIQKQLILGKRLYVCFIDFSSAFDMINRHILFFKLIKNGWHGRIIDTLRDLYSKTHFRIKHCGKTSSKIYNTKGVNQGGNASGFLFRKYMSDLSDYLKTEFGITIGSSILAHLLWADDLILLSDTLIGMKTQLNGLKKFCYQNQMS